MCYLSAVSVKNSKSVFPHVIYFCSTLFSTLALTVIKKEVFNSNFAEYSRTSYIAIYDAYNILKTHLYKCHRIHVNSMSYCTF